MKSDEFKIIALQASKAEYEIIMISMKNAAKKGFLTTEFLFVSEGAIYQLKEAGYTVHRKSRYPGGSALAGIKPTYYFEVGVK